ncbi:MAG: S8 family peptidase [Flavobacteriaceae bacterium]
MIKRIILGLSLALILTSCNTTKSIHNVAVPTNDNSIISIPAKKATLSEQELQQWPHADIIQDSIPGISLELAYQFVTDKKGTTVIVAVIDSGIDIEHEDLKDVLWTNPNEIAGNGIDNDKNGYVDDIYGWNFFGGANGENIPEQLELTRVYKKLHVKYVGKSEEEISKKNKAEYSYYKKVKVDYKKGYQESKENLAYFKERKEKLIVTDAHIQAKLNKSTYSLEDVKTLPEQDQNSYLVKVLSSGKTVEKYIARLDRIIKSYSSKVDVYYNVDFNGRIAGDDPYNIKDTNYGNAYVRGSLTEESHGTHVSGIILANRENNMGINGVATNVQLMTIRAVPNGDEYDKDVALAIRYAVDNGAKVINMSFGKTYATNPEWVYDAIKYAEKHDVLLVHAAGNDSSNLATYNNYPTDAPDKLNEIADNVITIGSSTRHFDEHLVSSFSNYGKNNVDVFAPGSEIYSTIPNNKYKMMQGTSMASPVVAGVAALIRSYYPELSASQVKHIIMNSGTKANFEVLLPGGEGKKVLFSELSVSGAIVNAHKALLLADKMTVVISANIKLQEINSEISEKEEAGL